MNDTIFCKVFSLARSEMNDNTLKIMPTHNNVLFPFTLMSRSRDSPGKQDPGQTRRVECCRDAGDSCCRSCRDD